MKDWNRNDVHRSLKFDCIFQQFPPSFLHPTQIRSRRLTTESFKGYAIESTEDWTNFKIIDFQPKREEDYDVTVKIAVCGICSSDVHTITGGWGAPILPLVPGHEVAGTVVKIGSKVTEFKIGSRVAVGAQVGSCLTCDNCKSNNENYCTAQVDTYNAKYSNGDIAHGGYANFIRAHERFVFTLPDSLSFEDSASLACAGLTVYSPMRRFGVTKGMKVGIAGIGGLGHYAIQIAKALGAEVTAFSHQKDKEDDCKKMGASEFVLSNEKDFASAHAMKFDFFLSTIDDSAGIPSADFLTTLKVNGRYHQVGLPDAALPALKGQDLASNGVSIAVSHIGSKVEAIELYKLAAEKGIKTWKVELPMKDVGKGVQMVKENTVRYRVILKQDLDSTSS